MPSSATAKKNRSDGSVDRLGALATLEAVEPGISKRDIVEQSSCFVFTGGEVVTYNDEVACRTKSPFNGVTGAVPAGKLLDLLRKITEDEVKVTATESELIISRKGRKRSGIRMESTILLPVETVEKPGKWKSLPDNFAEAVKAVCSCASNDQSRFYLTCCHIHPEWVEACDNYQICRWPLKMPIKKPILLRAQSVKYAASLGVDQFSETSQWVHFKGPSGAVLSCRRYVEDYPDWTKWLVVKGVKAELPKSLAEAAEIANLFSQDNPDVNLIRIYQRKPGEILVRGEGAFGWDEQPKPIKYDGPPLDFLIAPQILTDLVDKSTKCVLSRDRLKVHTDGYEYVTCLRLPEQRKEEAKPTKTKKPKSRRSRDEEE